MQSTKSVNIEHLGNSFELLIRKNPVAKKIKIRIDAKSGKPIATIPRYCTYKRAVAFAYENASWILAKLKANKPKIVIKNGETLTVLGENLTVCYQNLLRGATRKEGGNLLLYGEEKNVRKKTIDFIKEEVRKHAFKVATKYSFLLGVSFSKISIRDTSSRWGSCTSKGDISICWKLAFAPVPVLDYVIIHEVTHLKHMDHSEKFWKSAKRLFPDYEKAIKWLRCNSSTLQNIG